MFGYATDETEECMPLTVVLSHQLNAKIAQLRRSGDLAWARPDSKTQVIQKRMMFSYFSRPHENNIHGSVSLRFPIGTTLNFFVEKVRGKNLFAQILFME